MASYNTLRNGSSGDDVRNLQRKLVDAGYSVGSTGVDGIYGNATAAAVKKYQKDKGLSVDGIAGNQTLSGLLGIAQKIAGGATQTAPQAPVTPQAPITPQYGYDPSTNDAYLQALAALQQAQQMTPTYKGTYDQQLKDMYDKIANREKFTYDLNGDALYQQYKDQYTQQGKMAMMDTMGQAAALTGGYGSSYAQGVGQQAYQGYLQQLNDIVPELYSMALNQYNTEGDRMVQQYSMLGDMADTEYGRYQDDLNWHWQNINFLKESADTAYDRDFNNWYTGYQNQYQAERDKVADEQWQKEVDEAVRQYDQNYAFSQQQYEDAKNASNYSGSSYSNSSSSSSGVSGWGYDTHGYTVSEIMDLQRHAGIDVDGDWGPQTQAAWEAGYTKDGPPAGGGSGFTGTTYSEAVAYMKSKGVDNATASMVMTKGEWSRVKNSPSTSGRGGEKRHEADQFATYEEYLAYIVDTSI